MTIDETAGLQTQADGDDPIPGDGSIEDDDDDDVVTSESFAGTTVSQAFAGVANKGADTDFGVMQYALSGGSLGPPNTTRW